MAGGDGGGVGEQKSPAKPTAEIALPGGGFVEWVQDCYRRTRAHAEEYPYVWGSYVLVYGGLGAYLAWRWRKLRRTEDRVRVLQQRLKELVQAEEQQQQKQNEKGLFMLNGSSSSTSVDKPLGGQNPSNSSSVKASVSSSSNGSCSSTSLDKSSSSQSSF